MDFPAGSSSSSTSRAFYSQPFISQPKVYERSQNGLGKNSISLPVTSTFSDNEIIVLSSSDSEVELELNSTDNKIVVLKKDKGKEREHSTEPDLGTVSSAVNINTVQLNEPNLFGTSNQTLMYDKDKSEEQEESSPNNTGLNTTQIDDSDDELVDMEIDCDIPQPTTIASNQLISWAIDTELGPAVNNTPREQQLKEPNCIEKVIRFFNLYNYTFDIFDIVIDLSNKYQEIFQEDIVHLQPYHNNPCVLLELLSNLLSNRLNSDVRGTDYIKLEILAAEYYEKLKNAEIGRQGLYRTSFRSNKFHSTAKSLNEEKMSVINSRIKSNPPTTQDKKTKNKKVKKSKSSNGPKVDLEKILSSTVQLPEKEETKVPPLSITEHLNKFVFNQGGFIDSVTSNFSLNGISISSQGSKQTFSSPIFPTVDTNFSTLYGASNNQAVQTFAPNSQVVQTFVPNNQGVQTIAPNNQSLQTIAPNNQSLQTFAPNNQSLQTFAPNNQSLQTFAPNNQSLQTFAPNNQSLQTFAPNNQSLQTFAPNNQVVQTFASTSSNTGNHTVLVESGSQQATTTISYEINPNPPSNNEVTVSTEYNKRRHVEWPIPDLSFEVGKEYKSMMADAIQKLAITSLAMKHNPTSGPGELDSIVNKFKIKKIAKGSGSTQTYNETLINIFNHGGMNMVMERLEGNVSSHLKVKPKENRRQRKKRRLLQKQAKGECCGKKNDKN